MTKFRYQNTQACYICPKCFFKIAWKSNNYQFYLTNFLKFCDNISHKLLRPSQFLKKKRNYGMVHCTEINLTPSPYSVLQDVWREATPKLAKRNYLKYLQRTLIMGRRGLVSEFIWGIVDYYHQKVNVRVALREAEKLNIPKMLESYGEYLVGHPKNKFWELYWKIAKIQL